MTTFCVVGDIFDDYIADLTADYRCIEYIGRGSGYDVASGVAHEVGGAGLQFAIAAVECGVGNVTLIGKVGGAAPDLLDMGGYRAKSYLDSRHVQSFLATDVMRHTGRAIISYLPEGRRLMISDVGANATLCLDDLTDSMYDAVAESDLLYVSGFSLVQRERREATLALVKHAKSHGVVMAFDVVPHELDRYIEPSMVVTVVMGSADWVFAEASTARRLLQLGQETPDEEVLSALCHGGRSGAVFPYPSHAIIQHEGRIFERTFDYLNGAAARGQSARVHAKILVDIWFR